MRVSRKKLSSFESYEGLVKILKTHTIQREPFSVKMFSEPDKTELLKFFRETFYKHYSLYEIAGTKYIDYTLTTSQKLDQKLPHLPTLTEGEVVLPELLEALKMYMPSPNEELKSVKETQEGLTLTTEEDKIENRIQVMHTQPDEFDRIHEEKTEDELTLEKELDQTLQDFYDKFDKNLKVQEEKLSKLMPKTGGAANAKQSKK